MKDRRWRQKVGGRPISKNPLYFLTSGGIVCTDSGHGGSERVEKKAVSAIANTIFEGGQNCGGKKRPHNLSSLRRFFPPSPSSVSVCWRDKNNPLWLPHGDQQKEKRETFVGNIFPPRAFSFLSMFRIFFSQRNKRVVLRRELLKLVFRDGMS